MIPSLEAYENVAGSSVIEQLRRLGEKLKDTRIVHVNSTREGGGVADDIGLGHAASDDSR